MNSGHSHRAAAGIDDEVEIEGWARFGLLAALALAALATVVGVVVWWPSGDATEVEAAQFAAEGVTFPVGEVREVGEPCPLEEAPPEGCGLLTVAVEDRRVEVHAPPEVFAAGLAPGDEVELVKTPAVDGNASMYSYFATDRDGTLLWLLLLFLVVVVAIARWRGVFALVGLTFGALVVWKFVLPALLEGGSGVGVALTGASAIMFVVLYMTHGASMRTSTALAGTLVGVAMTALLVWWPSRTRASPVSRMRPAGYCVLSEVSWTSRHFSGAPW